MLYCFISSSSILALRPSNRTKFTVSSATVKADKRYTLPPKLEQSPGSVTQWRGADAIGVHNLVACQCGANIEPHWPQQWRPLLGILLYLWAGRQASLGANNDPVALDFGAQVVEAAKHRSIRGCFALVQAAAGERVCHHNAVGRQDIAHGVQEFYGQQVLWNVVAVEGVQHDDVVMSASATCAFHKGTAIVCKYTLVVVGPVAEIISRYAYHGRVDLDRIDGGCGQ